MRSYALRKGMIDVPNQRSSHTAATPRGGGVAIASTFLITIFLFGVTGLLSSNVAWALSGGGALIAFAGWKDDQGHLPISVRLPAHFLAAIWALFWLDGMTYLHLGVTTINMGWAGPFITAVGVVWLTNLYNFMDGIDGLAAAQAICAGLGGGLLLFLGGAHQLSIISLTLAAASAGFLAWNWPPARIFMGDIGSSLLGFSFAVIAIASEKSGALPVLGWLILLAIFVMDATFTLLRRVARKQAWLQAHNTHAYQSAVKLGASHLQVTLIVLALNILILWPLTWLVWWQPRLLFWVFLILGGSGWFIWLKIHRKTSKALAAR